MYENFKESCRKAGKHMPMGDGAIIFDEVKVISRLLWNSRSQTIVGLAMTAEDQVSLQLSSFTILFTAMSTSFKNGNSSS